MRSVLLLLLAALAVNASSYDKLWNDHVVWTRECAKAMIAHDAAETELVVNRLLRNQDDIGATLGAQIHNAAAGTEVAVLLKEHIALAAALLTAMIQGNSTVEPWAQWERNADVMADKFASLGQSRALWAVMLHKHLDLTHKEFQYLMDHDSAADVANFDAILAQAQDMAAAMAKATVPIDAVVTIPAAATTTVVAAPVAGYPAGATEVVYPNGYRYVYYNGYDEGWWVGIWILSVFVFFFLLMLLCVPCDDPYWPMCRKGGGGSKE